MKIHQHVLFKAGLSVVDCKTVIMAVQAVDQGLNRRFIEVAQVRCGLARFLSEHDCLRIDQSESINDNFTLDGLNRVYNNSNCTRI